jgi:hypothetical protein
MRILILHPADSPDDGPWSDSRWDLIVDLGFASEHTYEEWTRRLGARVLSIYQFAGQGESYRWVNQLLDHGRGRLFDRMGLDWWEILSVWSFHDLQALYLAKQLLGAIDFGPSEIMASRPHSFTRALEQILAPRVTYFEKGKGDPLRRIARLIHSVRRLRLAQIVEISGDKWDASFQLRRHLNYGNRARLSEPVVLLPSAYSNVTRTVLAYAAQLPQRRFLLVTTRRSALPRSLPGNVTLAPLAAYVGPSEAAEKEISELCKQWQKFLNPLPDVQEFRQAATAGFWSYFPQHLKNGLRLREAWRNLLDSEPVRGVLCGDDLNYYTRLPLLLAHRNNLQAVYCNHGALDGGFLFKLPVAGAFLVKGEMESDYLRRARNIDPEKIHIGAPGGNAAPINHQSGHDRAIVFFSQPYEVEGGRADAIYRELLPRLYSVAQRTGRKLIVKLHPFESLHERQTLVASILSKDPAAEIEIISRVPVEEVMSRAWCGIAIDSSVAVECALRGIPFFLCGWLDFMGVGYLRQFARFGLAHVLDAPERIEQIPEIADNWRISPEALQRIWHQADPAELELLLFGTPGATISGLSARVPASDASAPDDRQFSSTRSPRSRKVV